MKPETVSVICFAVYSVMFEAIVWGVFGYAVFILGHSGWWMLLAAFMSFNQNRPESFGIKRAPKTQEVDS